MATQLTTRARIAAAALTFSALGFSAYLNHEGFAPRAVPPIRGDVPTYGFGSILGPDDNPVKPGTTITPTAAVKLAIRDVQRHEAVLKKCLGDVEISQPMFDAFMSVDLNTGGVCNSSIPAKLRAGDYIAACETILDFGNFCTKPKIRDANGKLHCPPGALKPIAGLQKRRQAERDMCMQGVVP
ncbi:MAG: hypothetical protein LBP58_03210 [Azoarcus sp.]|jgi:lysozyme|nr:hypothetical protein [Azoarcus sp.]